jgi:hypothetical protein
MRVFLVVILLVGWDVSIDSEVSVVTSSISRSDMPVRDVHRSRLYVRVFIEMSVYTCI